MLDVSTFDEPPRYATYDSVLARFEREVIVRVNETMAGHDEALVYAELVKNLLGRLPCIELDERNLHTIAGAISRAVFPAQVWQPC